MTYNLYPTKQIFWDTLRGGHRTPQKMVCKACGEVLYESHELKAPAEIIEQLGGVCPRCNQKLKFDPSEVQVKIVVKEEPER